MPLAVGEEGAVRVRGLPVADGQDPRGVERDVLEGVGAAVVVGLLEEDGAGGLVQLHDGAVAREHAADQVAALHLEGRVAHVPGAAAELPLPDQAPARVGLDHQDPGADSHVAGLADLEEAAVLALEDVVAVGLLL